MPNKGHSMSKSIRAVQTPCGRHLGERGKANSRVFGGGVHHLLASMFGERLKASSPSQPDSVVDDCAGHLASYRVLAGLPLYSSYVIRWNSLSETSQLKGDDSQ